MNYGFDDPKQYPDVWSSVYLPQPPKPKYVLCCRCLEDWVELPVRACLACTIEWDRSKQHEQA